MNRKRKRTTRLVVSLTAAVLLASALVYTSFSASSEARSPSQLRDAVAGRSYELTGKVVPGYHREGDVLVFRVRDRGGSSTASVPVRYAGAVPDPFREGREVVITVKRRGAVWVGQPNSLITKCPSKFKTQAPPAKAPQY
jgi:cytochrome c-type biogenesis protein CcmE